MLKDVTFITGSADKAGQSVKIDKDLVRKAKIWVEKVYLNTDHLIRTGYWVKKIFPEASDSLLIAAITHDVERAFQKGRKPPSAELRGAVWDDHVYNSWHSKRSAKFVKACLRKEDARPILIKEVGELIEHHEEGGWNEADYLKDADSISFLEINVPMFINRIPDKLSKDEVKEKFVYMFERMTNKKAKEIAEPFYRKGLEKLQNID